MGVQSIFGAGFLAKLPNGKGQGYKLPSSLLPTWMS